MSSLDADPIFPLIGRIYDAALDPAAWPGVVREIARIQKSDKALLLTPLNAPDQGGVVFPSGISESAMQQWATRYIKHDIWTQAVEAKGLFVEGRVLTNEDLVNFDEFLGSIWYREFLSNIGIARLCTGVVFGTGTPGALPASFSVFRPVEGEPYGETERAVHRILVSHLSRSLGIMFRLRDAELKVAASLAALDRLNAGVVLFGARRAVLFANRAARSILGEEDGLRLRATPQGASFLAAESSGTQLAVDTALDQCLDPEVLEVGHFSQAVRIERSSGRAACTLNVSALPLQNEFGSGPERPLAIGFLNDPAEPVKVDEELLRRLYDLTPAECRLAQQICTAEPLAAIAARLGTSENTVKSQLQSIFAKTGTHRQAALVKLLHGLAATSQGS